MGESDTVTVELTEAQLRELVDVADPFTGRTYTGMISSYEATDEAGLTRLGEFGIEIVEGTE